MKAINKGIALLLLIVLVQTDLSSQWKPTNIKISLMTESISLPFEQFVFEPRFPLVKHPQNGICDPQ